MQCPQSVADCRSPLALARPRPYVRRFAGRDDFRMAEPIISIRDVSKTYKSGLQALKPINLD
ncbi:hypothetical protein, partial [Vitreimonas sp.]|uniref:hypothetical protein n=1 Tax=Vitreimonas sp. TaxID=3069702 RepID=UPI002ED84E6B